jgi:hypothetical protein
MMLKFQLLVGFAVLFDAPSVFSYVQTAKTPSLQIVAALKCPKKQYILQMTTSYQPDLDVRRKQSTGGSKISLNQINESCLPSTEARNTYDRKVTALMRYRELYGNIQVPSRFEVPDTSDQWPRETWKLKLGYFVANVRGRRSYKYKIEELSNFGFDFGVPHSNNMKYGYDLVKRALLQYKALNGDVLVQALYVIPSIPEWPCDMWGMKLGFISNNIRRGSSYADKREDLIAMGFDFESQHKYGYDLVRKALVKYKELHGHINVPARFATPINHPKWPSNLSGIKLGTVVHDIRRGSYSDKREDLLSMGFKYVLRKKFDYECVRIAVYKYRELHHGHTKISNVYKIPENDSWYPEETWGMCLGSYAKRIRSGTLWPDKYSDLFGI